jgi:hypothetical protein
VTLVKGVFACVSALLYFLRSSIVPPLPRIHVRPDKAGRVYQDSLDGHRSAAGVY